MARIIALIALLVLIGVAIFIFVAPGENGNGLYTPNGDQDQEENGTTNMRGWQIYSSQQLEFRYPPEATVGTEAGRVKVTYLGPNNEEGTEITDGFTLYVRAETVSATTSLRTVADNLYEEETQLNEAISGVNPIDVDTRTAYAFDVRSQLGTAVTHMVLEAEGENVVIVSYSISGTSTPRYATMIDTILGTLTVTGSVPEYSEVAVALLDTDFEGEPTRGCDRIVFVSRSVPTTTMPLTAALEELFSMDQERIDGQYYNFMARTNDTLSFNRAVVSDGTAHVYLTGQLSGLAGVCDNPRAQIQIEETARQFSTVEDVQIYLNGSPTTLTPSGQ